MSDIFREVEEDVRRERFAKLWKQYGDYFIAAVVALAVAGAGFAFWQRYEAGQRAKASAAFIAAQSISVPGPAESAFAKIAADAPGGYRLLARLEQANTMLASGNSASAVTLYKSIAADDSGPIGAVARLRAAWALADTSGRDDLESLLGPLTDPKSPWSQLAREVLAYADLRAGDSKAAEGAYESLASDPDSPDALRMRARAMADFIKSGMGDYGTVPPPPAPTSAAGAAPATQAAPEGPAKP